MPAWHHTKPNNVPQFTPTSLCLTWWKNGAHSWCHPNHLPCSVQLPQAQRHSVWSSTLLEAGGFSWTLFVRKSIYMNRVLSSFFNASSACEISLRCQFFVWMCFKQSAKHEEIGLVGIDSTYCILKSFLIIHSQHYLIHMHHNAVNNTRFCICGVACTFPSAKVVVTNPLYAQGKVKAEVGHIRCD